MFIANMFVILFLTYYTVYLLTFLIDKNKRFNTQQVNIKLNTLRNIPVKTIEQQKMFINLRYPKRKIRNKNRKYVFHWKPGLSLMGHIFLFIFLVNLYLFVFMYFNIEIKLWQAILFIILFSFGINYLLKKIHLNKNELSIIMR